MEILAFLDQTHYPLPPPALALISTGAGMSGLRAGRPVLIVAVITWRQRHAGFFHQCFGEVTFRAHGATDRAGGGPMKINLSVAQAFGKIGVSDRKP